MTVLKVLACCLLISFSSSAAEKSNKPALKKRPVLSISELKDKLSKAPEGLKKFYAHTEIVNKYGHENLTPENQEEARNFASELLLMAENYKKDWNYGNALHDGNLVLGRLALRSGDVTTAKDYLKRSCEIKGSPQLNSFGPHMTLAKELLEKKEKVAVLNYIDCCLKFWTPAPFDDIVTEWKAAIKQDKIPDFGGNLVY